MPTLGLKSVAFDVVVPRERSKFRMYFPPTTVGIVALAVMVSSVVLNAPKRAAFVRVCGPMGGSVPPAEASVYWKLVDVVAAVTVHWAST